MRQADGVSTAPRNELKLDQPIQLGHRFVAFLPIAVQTQHLGVQVVDHQDVWSQLAFAVTVVFERQVRVDVVHSAHAVFVVLPLLAFDLVVGLFRSGHRWLLRGLRDHYVFVQTTTDPVVELFLRDVLNFRHALRGVEVCSREWQHDVVDRHELSAWATLLLVVPELHELRPTQRQLSEHLLLLVAELLDLLGELPVHVITLAVSASFGFLIHVANDVGAHRTVGREQLFDRPRFEIDTGLSHHRVHHLGRTREGRSTRCVVAQPGAPQPLFVLLVALFPRLLVFFNQVDVLQRDLVQVPIINLVSQIGVEVLIFLGTFELVHADDR